MTKLEQIIKDRGIRKFRLAQSLDISESTLSAWAVNGLPRSAKKVAMLADLLNVPLEDLFEDTLESDKRDDEP